MLNHEPEANFGAPWLNLKQGNAVLAYYIASRQQSAFDDFLQNTRIGEYGVYRMGEVRQLSFHKLRGGTNMSHRSWCDSEDEAERRARYRAHDDAQSGYRSYSTPYDNECPEAKEAYEREYRREYYREEARIEEERAEHRAQESRRRQREEEAYSEQQRYEQERYESEARAQYEAEQVAQYQAEQEERAAAEAKAEAATKDESRNES